MHAPHLRHKNTANSVPTILLRNIKKKLNLLNAKAKLFTAKYSTSLIQHRPTCSTPGACTSRLAVGRALRDRFLSGRGLVSSFSWCSGESLSLTCGKYNNKVKLIPSKTTAKILMEKWNRSRQNKTTRELTMKTYSQCGKTANWKVKMLTEK